jgi:hypothetical protein
MMGTNHRGTETLRSVSPCLCGLSPYPEAVTQLALCRHGHLCDSIGARHNGRPHLNRLSAEAAAGPAMTAIAGGNRSGQHRSFL